jgi:N-acyl-D-aspartate/D-glutamate deacylase
MEGVEDIPGAALHEGLSWDWQSFPEYLDALDRRPHDIDFAAQVPHGAVRLHVMGERGANREVASAEEIERMGAIVREAVEAGALGFTTSRTLNHRTSRGEPTPTLTAARDELVGIAAAIGKTGRGVLQVVSDFSVEGEDETFLEMMRASGRPLSFSLLQVTPGPSYAPRLELLDRANAEGLSMRAQVAARPVGVLLGLQTSVNPLSRCPSFVAVADLPLAQQASTLSQPEARAQLVAEARGSMLGSPAKIFELGDPPDYEPAPDDAIAVRAQRLGIDPIELYVDLLLADEGRSLLYLPFLNYADGNLDAAAEMLGHPHTVPGLGDGGAHVGTICDGSFPTTLLVHWARDRRRGTTFDLPFLVHRQCRATAEAVGLLDRGVLAPGYKADVTVIDFDHLALSPPRVVYDLPAGGKRLMQDARGYVHTIVSGVETYTDGQPTGELPGRLVRGQQADAAAVAR